MFHKTLICVSLSVLAVGCATSPSPPAASKANAAKTPAGCISEVASCAGFGRAYTKDDIKRTGASDTAQALPLLDPALTVHTGSQRSTY